MTIIEKMYAGEKLNEYELQAIATGYSPYCNTEVGEYQAIDHIEKDCDGLAQSIDTIINVGDDLWCIPWEQGYCKNEFPCQPYSLHSGGSYEL